jgi:8-oxo-dGTP pyrophosphatase MutT (NUDIX family)
MARRVFNGFVKVDIVETPEGPREVVVATDSVAFLVYNQDNQEVLLVSQCRAPMIRADNPAGELLEVAAGRFDVDLGVKGLIQKELEEELGIKLSDTEAEEQIETLNNGIPLALSPGVLTERQYLAVVTVHQNQINPESRLYGVDADEKITRKFVPVDNIHTLQIHDMKTFALLEWFYAEYCGNGLGARIG